MFSFASVMITIVKQLISDRNAQLSADSVQFTFLHFAAFCVPLYFRTQIKLQNISDEKLKTQFVNLCAVILTSIMVDD